MEQIIEQNFEEYHKKGQYAGAIGAVVMLIVGVGVSVMVLIFVGALGGQTYQLVEADIDDITNTTIKNSIKNSIVAGFSGLEKTGQYIPIIVLAIVITIVLALILTFTNLGGGMGGRGGAL
jgi:diacylglycerol kinase